MVRQQHKLEEIPCEILISAVADSLRLAAVGNHPLLSSAVADKLTRPSVAVVNRPLLSVVADNPISKPKIFLL